MAQHKPLGLVGTVSGQNPSQLPHLSGETGTRGTVGTSSTFPPAHLLSQGRQHQLPCTLPKQPTLSPHIQHSQTVPEWQTPEAVPLKSSLKAEARKSRAAVLGRPACTQRCRKGAHRAVLCLRADKSLHSQH